MGKLTVTAFITLDNVVEDPHLWSGDFQSDDTGELNDEVLREADAMLLGRVTYEGFAAAWPSRSGDPFADKFNAMPKYVVSTTLERADWNNTRSSPTTSSSGSARCASEQNVLVWGSPTLVQTLMDEGLVDEYVLLVSPIVRGKGIRLCRRTAPSATCGSPSRRLLERRHARACAMTPGVAHRVGSRHAHSCSSSIAGETDPGPHARARAGDERLQRGARAGRRAARARRAAPAVRGDAADASRAASGRRVTDGPFTEAKELVGGYWIIQARSKEEAVEWASRAPVGDGTIEVRQIAEEADYPPEIAEAARLSQEPPRADHRQPGSPAVAAGARPRAIDAIWRIESGARDRDASRA